MPDDAIHVAMTRRAEAEERIRRYERGIKKAKDQIIEINKFIAQWEKFSGRIASPLSGDNPLPEKADLPDQRSVTQPRMIPVNSRKEEVADAARGVLSAVGKPLSRSDLFAELVKRGLTITGKDPEMVLSTMLWRTRETSGIERLKSGGYCLKGSAAPDEIDEGDDGSDDPDALPAFDAAEPKVDPFD